MLQSDSFHLLTVSLNFRGFTHSEVSQIRVSLHHVSGNSSSTSKGETLLDTARNLEAMRIDMVVMRHGSSGSARFLAERIPSNVINAGDGWHEHPTQALLDLYTMRVHVGPLDGLGVAIALEALMQDWQGPWGEKRAGGR